MENMETEMENTSIRKDKVIEAVREDLLQRSIVGIRKYKTTLEENQGDELYWLQHIYEELLDAADYVKRLMMEKKGEL